VYNPGKSRALIVGHFSSADSAKNLGASAAGDLVQMQIIADSKKIVGDKEVRYFQIEPQQSWPRGKLWVGGKETNLGCAPKYMNIIGLRSVVQALSLFQFIVKTKPRVVLVYNSYLLEGLVLLLVKQIIYLSVIVVVQDVRVGSSFTLLSRIHDFLSCKLLKYFDFVIPVSDKLAVHLELKKERYVVFPGAATLPSLACVDLEVRSGGAVVAGALEAYNGIDRLVNAWIAQGVQTTLHVFGRGSLSGFVVAAAARSSNIVFHGVLPPEEVYKWQLDARFNICLRYPEGLEEEFFFPSKFFNACSLPGLLVVNDFKGLPAFLRTCAGYVGNDLLDLKRFDDFLDEDINFEQSKVKMGVSNRHSWESLLRLVYSKFSLPCNLK
jgi:hypothetical protein